MTPDRAAILAEADQLLHQQTFSKETGTRISSLLQLADSLVDREPLRRATTNARSDELGRPRPFLATPDPDQKFMAFLREGKSALTPEERVRIYPGREATVQLRAAQSVGTNSAGGYLVPSVFADNYETVLQATDPLFKLAGLWETANGSASGYPLVDEPTATAAIVAENGNSASESDVVFADVAFGACPTWRTSPITVSVELAQDSRFDLTKLLSAAFAIRMARGVGASFMATLITAAGAGVTTASTTAITPDELWGLVEALDPAYLPGACFLMKQSTFLALMKLKGSGSGDYVFRPTFDGAGNPTLCGNFPVYFSPSAGAMTAGLTPILFGRMDKFVRRQVRDSMAVRVLIELYAASGKIGYIMFLRVDGQLLQGSSGPIPVQALVMHA